MISRVTATLLWVTCAIGGDLRLYEAVEPHMGTLVRIKLYASAERQAADGFRMAFARIAHLDEALSDYRTDSELNRVCVTAVHTPTKVSGDLFRVLAAAQKLAAESDGAFDVTLGPVIRLWRTKQVPLPDALREAGAHCDYRKLHLDPAAHTVELDENGMQIDLGGIAKGYAASEAVAALAATGITRTLVALSGDIAAGDPPPGFLGWRVAIGDSGEAVELCRAAISTSGDSEQHVDAGGTRYSHIIDPRTLMGLTTRIEVTVISPRGIDADALSTAISILGAERGLALLRCYPDAAARIATPAVRIHSPGWPAKPLPLHRTP